jgi:hypothetical protein
MRPLLRHAVSGQPRIAHGRRGFGRGRQAGQNGDHIAHQYHWWQSGVGTVRVGVPMPPESHTLALAGAVPPGVTSAPDLGRSPVPGPRGVLRSLRRNCTPRLLALGLGVRRRLTIGHRSAVANTGSAGSALPSGTAPRPPRRTSRPPDTPPPRKMPGARAGPSPGRPGDGPARIGGRGRGDVGRGRGEVGRRRGDGHSWTTGLAGRPLGHLAARAPGPLGHLARSGGSCWSL